MIEFEGWVARDKSGKLFAYSQIPLKLMDRYIPTRQSVVFELPEYLFSDLEFEHGARPLVLRDAEDG